MSNNKYYHIWTDGACRGNPGPGGYAAIVFEVTRNGKPLGKETIVRGATLDTTNNRMEIMAAKAALDTVPDGAFVRLRSDSLYVVNTMKGFYKQKKNRDLWIIMNEHAARLFISWEHTKGHANDPYNNMCDQLARGEVGKLVRGEYVQPNIRTNQSS